MHLSHTAAQQLMVAAQGLHRWPDQPATKADVLDTIRHMGALQIDTIHVVARSPYLVLWSRLGTYDPDWLDQLLAEKAVFEYWSHEACFLPIEDYPLYRRLMLGHDRGGWLRARQWATEHRDEVNHMLAFIREHGPVRSSDFIRTDGQTGSWWNWKPEKVTLEVLHTLGELMITQRSNFHRIYDLRERVVPLWDDINAPSLDEVRRLLTLKAVRALGITSARWVPDYFRTRSAGSAMLLETLVVEGNLRSVEVTGWDLPAYIHPDNVPLAEAIAHGTVQPELTTLLSPFDPLVWDRKRARAIFGFDYTIECYTPAAKRRYGYFSLPILRRGALVGRLDPKAHRATKVFEVKALHLEPGIPVTHDLVQDLAVALHQCATWHQTPEIVIRWTDPPELAAPLQQTIRDAAKLATF